MRYQISIGEYSITTETEYTDDFFNEKKQFPWLTIGTDSYLCDGHVDFILDENMVYNFQIGRYTSIAENVSFLIDMNHDYKRVYQGLIHGIPNKRPKYLRRKGHLIIMNDCWIGTNATILSGVTIGNGAVVAADSVVTKNVPPYAIVSGNPAKVIGYRFTEDQIAGLNFIRWWNWSPEKLRLNATNMQTDINTFIATHLPEAQEELNHITPANIQPIEKHNIGDEKILLYIPDFEQDYPTYPRVIQSFAEAYNNTNYELLIYVKEDEFLEDKLSILDAIFSKYESANCYINLYIDNLTDVRALFCQADAYITNRSKENVYYMDVADLFGLTIISSVDIPIFHRQSNIGHIIRKTDNTTKGQLSEKDIQPIIQSIHSLADTQKNMQNTMTNLLSNQYIFSCSFNNLPYEILATEKPKYPIIKPGEEAINLIIHNGKSICRFGDGEFAIMAGKDRQKFQEPNPHLAKRLTEILHSNYDNILICIANNYGDLSEFDDEARYNIRVYETEDVRSQHYELLDMNRTYYDAYLSRPYILYRDKFTQAPHDRFNHLKQIWKNRDILIIEGAKTRMGIGNDLFSEAKSIIRILGPAEHAYNQYDNLLKEAKKYANNRLVLIALGATATVLAYDLACSGFQALDIGHVDLEYEWMLAGVPSKTIIPNKYTNEVPGGEIVSEIHDSIYESQIVAKYL